MIKYLPLLFLLMFFEPAIGQDAINSDLPDQTDGTHIVESKHLQIETGTEFSKIDDHTSGFVNETVLRYGVSKRLEIRLLDQYEVTDGEHHVDGFQPITVSSKYLLCYQQGLLPKLIIVTYLQMPFGISKNFPANHLGYAVVLASRHTLNSKLKFYSNIGVQEDQESTDLSFPATAEINYQVSDAFSGFIEYFGSFSQHTNAANGLDLGLNYNLKKNIAVNIAVGSPTMKLSENRFVVLGLAVRLPH